NGQEGPSQGPEKQSTAACEDRSLVSPDGESQLPADDRTFSAAFARHDHSLLSGLVSDVVHRPASVHGLDILHLQFLSCVSTRTVSENLAESVLVPSSFNGLGNRSDHHQYKSGYRGAAGQ